MNGGRAAAVTPRARVDTYFRWLHQLVLVLVHLGEEVGGHVAVPDEHVALRKSLLHVNQLDVKHQHGAAWDLVGCTQTHKISPIDL